MSTEVVIVAGISGSGKSTLAQALAGALPGEYIEADDYHDKAAINKMQNGIPLNDADRMPWLLRLNEKLRQHTSVIQAPCSPSGPYVLSCSALKAQYREVLVDNLDAKFIWLEISKELASERMAARAGHYMPPSLAQSQLDIAEPPEDALILDAAERPETLLAKSLSYLGTT